MQIAELWRYPVKSLRGEQLAHAELLPEPGLLGLAGTLGDDGVPLIEGHPWNHPRSIAAVEAAAGAGATLVLSEGPERFDVLPLSILTDGAIAALGVDRRRLRPNILIGGVDGLSERDWPGRELRIGSALVAVVKLRPRCVMTTFDPDTLAQDHGVLRRIVTDFGGVMALDAFVVEPGSVRVGDAVHVLA